MNLRFVGFAALGLLGCHSADQKLTQLPSADTAGSANEVVSVDTSRAESAVVTRDVIATGTLEPAREANLGAQMTARITNVLVKEGDNVVAGQPLAQLDSMEASLRSQSTAANVASSQSQYELARAEYERLAPLVGKGSVTAQQIERLERQRDTLKASAQAMLVAESDAKRNMGNTSVRAPFGGIVSKVYVEVGEVVTLMPVTNIVRLVDLSSVDVRVRVHERELAGIAVGNNVKATLSATGDKAQGKVTFISPEIDPRTRTAEVVTRLPNADKQMRAGMFAEIAISPSRSHESVVLPTTAIAGAGANRYVFVLRGEAVERTKVKVAPLSAEQVEVLEGVKAGDEVVNTGLGKLTDGAHVKRAGAEDKTAGIKAGANPAGIEAGANPAGIKAGANPAGIKAGANPAGIKAGANPAGIKAGANPAGKAKSAEVTP